MKKFECMLMAGGINRIEFHKGQPNYKALIKFQGKSSIEYVLAALKKCKYVKKVVLCGPPLVKGYKAVGSRGYILNAINKCSRHIEGENIFVTMADLPLLRTEMLNAFFEKALGDADFYITFVQDKYFNGHFKKFGKPFNKFRDGKYAHGNLIIFRKSLLHNKELMQKIENFYRVRKSELKLAYLPGKRFWFYYFLNSYLLQRLETDDVATMLEKVFGVKIKVIKLKYPELTLDLDEKKDYELIKEIFASRVNRRK